MLPGVGGKISESAVVDTAKPVIDEASLAAIIERRSEEQRRRDQWRNPAETLAFFGVTADMTVVETLPGGGWYSRILIPYLDQSGQYAAAN